LEININMSQSINVMQKQEKENTSNEMIKNVWNGNKKYENNLLHMK